MTDDVVDARRERFLRHIAGSEARGEALAACLPAQGRILEVGCGTGGLLVAAARAGLDIAGVDIAARWLVVARRRLTDHGLEVPLVAASAERLPWPDGHFDAVVADSVLEHLDAPSAAVREWARVLRPGGRLVVWSPNRFTLATDPHVGLWGVGWLPRSWVRGYLRLRGRDVWPPRTLSAAEARRLATAPGLGGVEVDVPGIPEGWARTLPGPQRLLIRAYEASLKVRPAPRPAPRGRAALGAPGDPGGGRMIAVGTGRATHPPRPPRWIRGRGRPPAPARRADLADGLRAVRQCAGVRGDGPPGPRLGPPGFARVEFASAVAAWLLVVVRGGVDVIVYREAARRPRLVRPLTELLIGLRIAAALVGYAIVLVVAALTCGDRGAVVAVAGLMLVPSAFVADVGLRAEGRLRAWRWRRGSGRWATRASRWGWSGARATRPARRGAWRRPRASPRSCRWPGTRRPTGCPVRDGGAGPGRS